MKVSGNSYENNVLRTLQSISRTFTKSKTIRKCLINKKKLF